MSIVRTIACVLALLAATGCTVVGDDLYESFDADPPRVVASEPADGAAGVPVGITCRVWFNEPVEPATVDGDAVVLVSGEHVHLCRLRVDQEPDGRGRLEVEPLDPLIPAVAYHLRLGEQITDRVGNPLAGPVDITFRTAE